MLSRRVCGAVLASVLLAVSVAACGEERGEAAQDVAPTVDAELDVAQEPGVGVEGTTFETVNTEKAREFAERAATEPISSELSPEEAIEMYGQYMNIYYTSGEVDVNGNETPESVAQGEAILQNMYGQNASGLENSREIRRAVANGLDYLNNVGGAPDGAIGTYHIEYEALDPSAEGWHFVEVTVETNFYDLDSAFFQDSADLATSSVFERQVRPTLSGDQYFFSQSSSF